MDKNEFVKMVSQPREFTSQERGWLKAKVAQYPHSSVLRTLALLADHAYGYDTPDEQRSVMLSMCSSAGLVGMLAGAAPKDIARSTEPSVDILNEINTFQEVSFKTAPKSVILSNFLQTNSLEEEKNALSPVLISNEVEKKCLQEEDVLGTETLAVILEQQGRYDKALAIYRNLLARNPEKSSIFAPRIEKLESQINSK